MASHHILSKAQSKLRTPHQAFLTASLSRVEFGSACGIMDPMPKANNAKKKVAAKRAKTKAAEDGVSAAQRVFKEIVKKADPKRSE